MSASSSAICAFQSPLPVRGGTFLRGTALICNEISIHPPRAGRDSQDKNPSAALMISIRPPRAGRDCQ